MIFTALSEYQWECLLLQNFNEVVKCCCSDAELRQRNQVANTYSHGKSAAIFIFLLPAPEQSTTKLGSGFFQHVLQFFCLIVLPKSGDKFHLGIHFMNF